MEEIDVRLVSWNQFLTRGLAIVPEIMGLTCDFQFENSGISIEIPSTVTLGQNPFDDKAPIVPFGWEKINGKEVVNRISVKNVDVLVDSGQHTKLPKDILTKNPNAKDIVTAPQQQLFKKIIEKQGVIAERAFDLWIRTIRWKTNAISVGRPEIQDYKSGWSTQLIDPVTRKHYWIGGYSLTLNSPLMLSVAQWNEVNQSLVQGARPPIYIERKLDGIYKFNLEDFQGATIDLAIACEAYLRSLLMSNLPVSISESVRKHIDEANISQLLNHFMKDVFSATEYVQYKKIRKDLSTLFSVRNGIMHSGHTNDLTPALCKKIR